MCGICGVVNFSREPVSEPVLSAMAGRLRHRGPDALRVAQPAPWMGLGHTRLKVIDLSDAANQPMANRDGSVWIAYNGEVYNYRSLRQELEGHGRRFVTQSDTEVVLQAYEQWGERCLTRLDGMFALAIADCAQRHLLLARDRTGKKPLFYHADEERLVFASEIKALLAHPSVPCEVNERALPLYLAYGYVPSPETSYAGIRALPPASQLLVEWPYGRRTERTYWMFEMPEEPARITHEDAMRGVRERLREAVRSRLMADVPLGAFLSGGVDSTIVVGLMSELLDRPVHTFTIGFTGDPARDERAYARLVADRFKTRHTEFVVEPKAFELLQQLVYQHDQPFGDASAIPTFLLCQLARAHVTVALNGDGGDESFAGYLRFHAALVSGYLPQGLSAGMAWAIARLPRSVQRAGRIAQLRRFFEAAARPWDERLVRWISYHQAPVSLLREELRPRFDPDAWLAPARRHLQRVAGLPALSQALYFNFQEYLPNDLNVKMDRCSMAHGLETRSPFLDTAVIEYAAQLPGSMKIRGLARKAILKEAFTDLLPAAVTNRPKQGFGVPLDHWFRGELRAGVQELLLAPEARLRAYLDPGLLQRCWDGHLSGERDAGLPLWNLLTLEVWLRGLPQARSGGHVDAPAVAAADGLTTVRSQ